jgi:methionine-rich copper-binding protein CopC
MNNVFTKIAERIEWILRSFHKAPDVSVRHCGAISARKIRKDAIHKYRNARYVKSGIVDAISALLCREPRRYAMLICYAVIFVTPLGGVRIASADIISVSDGTVSVGVGTVLATCEGRIAVTFQMPLGEIYRLTLFGTVTTDADNRIGTGNRETIEIIVPGGESTIQIQTEVTGPKGSRWLAASKLRATNVSRTVSILEPERSPSIAIIQQPIGGDSSGTLQTQPVVRLVNQDDNLICDNTYVIKASVNNDTGALTGTTEIQTNASGGVIYTDIGLSGAVETDHAMLFTLFRDGQERASTVLAEPIRYAAPADTTAPTLLSTAPMDNATGVAVDSNIVLTFSEPVETETGDIVIKRVSDNAAVQTFDVATSTAIAGSGTTTITLTPAAALASATAYYVQIAATAFDDLAGNSYAGITDTATLNFTTASPPAPPNTIPIANAGPDQTVQSAAVVTLDGAGSSDPDGDTLTHAWAQTAGIAVTLTGATAPQPTFTAPTLDVGDSDATLVFSLVVNDGTSNSAADSVTISIAAPMPTAATEFVQNAPVIKQVLVDDADRSLRGVVAANHLMMQDARSRFVASQIAPDLTTRNDIPLDMDGAFSLSGKALRTNGRFFGQRGSADGFARRVVFGDFSVQRDGDTGSTTATLTARVAWERLFADSTMLGHFIGGEVARSEISGGFAGDQNRVALTIGGYAVHQLTKQVYLDGVLSLGAGRNDLEMANDVLVLTSDHMTRTAAAGIALSGVYVSEHYELRPELALNYGKTWIGDVGFTARAYGLVDDTQRLDAGNVSIAHLTLRPEVIWALDADRVADSNKRLSFAPRMICERTIAATRADHCGGGAEISLSSLSEDGLTNVEFRVIADRLGSSNRSSYKFNLEHRF